MKRIINRLIGMWNRKPAPILVMAPVKAVVWNTYFGFHHPSLFIWPPK